jgi:cytochrome c5
MICTSAVLWGLPLRSQDSAVSRNANDNTLVEKGRNVVGNVCVACHTNILRIVEVHKKSPAQWKDTVYSMIGRGAQVMPDEIDSVALFLSDPARNASVDQDSTEGGTSRARGNQPTESDGRGILERSCEQCHDLATASRKQGSEDWNVVVEKMVNYGARLNATDKHTLVDYLKSLEK